MATTFSWVLQLHKGVPKAARFYSQGLDFAVNVCTLRWAELQSGPLKLALVHSNRSQQCVALMGPCWGFMNQHDRLGGSHGSVLKPYSGLVQGFQSPREG
ncbi:uncharacterized protein LOC110022268 isoform X1 [Phalaenopsis equestris]|uniref:uncharacterized protein LOC110022268 isoform X1 n=1 Tax=Phalaenopsis equestris TaxID=78828 RepID=UPI0009E644C4|nr:uncharacterized protein LOC110022268 isoform X1 [Phalaenopsis equestris]